MGLIDLAENKLLTNVEDGMQSAIEFFLKNRSSDRWKDKVDQTVEISGEMGIKTSLDLSNISDKDLEVLEGIIEKAKKKTEVDLE